LRELVAGFFEASGIRRIFHPFLMGPAGTLCPA
jgi:hypothetical protein